uniref:Putative ovule protein n=1 Tax=Solanum chacoense TaxID=4108 RepID=A0A0V0GNC8_SOLCH
MSYLTWPFSCMLIINLLVVNNKKITCSFYPYTCSLSHCIMGHPRREVFSYYLVIFTCLCIFSSTLHV